MTRQIKGPDDIEQLKWAIRAENERRMSHFEQGRAYIQMIAAATDVRARDLVCRDREPHVHADGDLCGMYYDVPKWTHFERMMN